MKIVIDTDPGTDDALAIMMALNSPGVEVLGLTTVGGNASLADTTRNALSILERLGRTEIPVSRGAARPLHGAFRYGYHFHGAGGLTVRLPAPTTEPIESRAPEFIIQHARSIPGHLVLIALGPLTNVARAIAREPHLVDWLREIVVMDGAVEVPGNVTPAAEFNAYNDPAAANAVFSSGIPVTLVGLDVCNEVTVERDDAAWLSEDSSLAPLARTILGNWFSNDESRTGYSLCDPLAMAAAVQPGLLTLLDAVVDVDAGDGDRYGKTTARYGDGHVRVASNVRVRDAKDLIHGLLKVQ